MLKILIGNPVGRRPLRISRHGGKKLRRVRATIVAVEKSISITYSEGLFVALGIQHAMRRIIL